MHRFCNCNKLETQVTPAGEAVLEGGERGGAISVQGAMSAVMEAKDVSVAAGIAPRRVCRDGLHTLNEPIGGWGAPVAGDERPHYGAHSQGARGGDDPGIAEAVGRTKPCGGGAGDCADRFLAPLKLGSNARGSAPKKVRMRVGMIGDEMAAGGDFADKVRAFAGEAADEKKCGAGTMNIEQVEEPWSDGRIRTVIEGQGEFCAACGAAYRAAEELGTRENGAVDSSRHGSAQGGGTANQPGSRAHLIRAALTIEDRFRAAGIFCKDGCARVRGRARRWSCESCGGGFPRARLPFRKLPCVPRGCRFPRTHLPDWQPRRQREERVGRLRA